MAIGRPRKDTVEFFPHYCDHKITLPIIEKRYANDGYTFWFKLLELLGKSHGHFIKYDKVWVREHIATKSNISVDRATEILNLLADLEAIDQDLWKNSQIIWCQHFVDNLKELYSKRSSTLPQKPSPNGKLPKDNILPENTTSEEISDPKTTKDGNFRPENTTSEEISDPKIPQTKLNNTKLNNTTLSKDRGGEPPINFEEFNDLLKLSKNKIGTLVEAFKLWHTKAPPEDFEKIGDGIASLINLSNKDYGYILKLIWDSCSASIAGSHLNYIRGIIKNKKNFKVHNKREEASKEHEYIKIEGLGYDEYKKTIDNITPEIDIIWTKMFNFLREKMNKANYELLLKDAKAIAFDNNKFIVLARDIVHAQIIEDRLSEKIEAMLADILKKDVALKIVYLLPTKSEKLKDKRNVRS